MKKWFAILSVFTLYSFSTAQNADQVTLIHDIEGPVSIVFIPKVIHPWYDVVQQGADFAVQELAKQGIDVKVEFDAPAVADINEHIRKIEDNTGRRPSGIAVACLDPATDTQAINDALNAGVNVSTFDTDCPDSNRLFYVGHNKDYQDGVDLADVLAEKIGDKGKVGILSGSLSAPNHRERVRGFKEAMAQHPDIQIVFEQPDNDDLQRAVDLTESALQANPDIVGFFGSNASAPIGAARAVTNAGKSGEVHIVGMDDLPEAVEFVQAGTIDALKAQRQWEIGYWTVKYFVAMLQGHTIPAEHATGSRLLTSETLGQ